MTNEPSPRPWHFNGMRPTIYSDEKLPDGSARVVLDINTDHLPLLPCDKNDRQLIADIGLIVDAVNERDLIAARLEAFDKKLEEAVAIHDALCAERDRLRDLVKRLITIHQNIFWRKDEKTGILYYDCAIDEEKIRKTIEEARAAIGEDRT